jgi:hypothetical protein
MENLLTRLLAGGAHMTIEYKNLVRRGSTQYSDDMLESFPSLENWSELVNKNKIDDDYRLVGVSRPTDLSLNRWNFVFSNDVRTLTDLEKPCDLLMLQNNGTTVTGVDIYQSGE